MSSEHDPQVSLTVMRDQQIVVTGLSHESLVSALTAAFPQVRLSVMHAPEQEAGPKPRRRPRPEVDLTSRELEVLAMIARGFSNQEIADAACLSINSIKSYVRGAYSKIGVVTRSQAVAWGVRHGLGNVGGSS